MENAYKFGQTAGGKDEIYVNANIWCIEKTIGPERLLAAPRGEHIELIQKLFREMPPPYGVLYILHVPRASPRPGRFQHPDQLSSEQLDDFLERHRLFLEGDGRHTLWILSVNTGGLVIYDRHNLLYAYGPLTRFQEVATAEGLLKASEIRLPDPHSHHYNVQFDADEMELITSVDWIHSALGPDED